MQIQIRWLLQKPTDLDLHCLQRQGIFGFSRTRVKLAKLIQTNPYLSKKKKKRKNSILRLIITKITLKICKGTQENYININMIILSIGTDRLNKLYHDKRVDMGQLDRWLSAYELLCIETSLIIYATSTDQISLHICAVWFGTTFFTNRIF